MKAYVLLLALLVTVSLVLVFVQKTPKNCECQGLGAHYCLGKISCENTQNCITLTCENRYQLLGNIDTTQDRSQTYTILIIDASKSMEGENIDATKRASKEFVKEIDDNQYLAVIEFNEEATLLSDFSNDKIDLYNSVDLITPYGRTRFLEPFTLANELFENVPEQARKYILFLSDGAPEDDETTFLKQIELLKEKNVNTYALAFADKSNEKLMKEIASKDSNLFLVSTSTDIEAKFKEAYINILEGGDVELAIIDKADTYRKQESIQAKLLSLHNEQDLLAQTEFCPLETTSYLEAKKGTGFSRILGSTTGQIISFPLNSLDSGLYELVAHSKVFLDECTLSTTELIGNIQIAQEEDCEITCQDIEFAMKGEKNESYVSTRESMTWNIFVDKSSSMNQLDHLKKAIKDTNTIIEFIPAYEKVSMYSFDNKVDTIYKNQIPRSISSVELETLVPSASTSLVSVLKKIVEQEKQANSRESHSLIITDGAYGKQPLNEINQTLQQIKGCISTINYGTHLLTANESAYKLLQQERKCGEDFITQPSREELQQIIGTNISTKPEIKIQLRREESQNQTTIYITPISTFTGEMPLVQNEKCNLYPLTSIDLLQDGEVIETISGTVITINANQSFRIKSSFDNSQCPYTKTKEVTPPIKKEKSKLLDIIAIVALVLAINMLVFVYVLHRRIKKLTRIR